MLTANRDEFYERPSRSLHRWEEGFYAGKDLKAGGTWMGMHPDGRFAALTNYRDIANEKNNRTSRGELVTDYLKGSASPIVFLEELQSKKDRYNGFSLLVADGSSMYFLSNYQDDIQKVTPGIHGLSNALLDTPWPKVALANAEMAALSAKGSVSVHDGLALLQTKVVAAEQSLPSTGLDPALEKAVSAQYVEVDDYYGTVSTTALLWTHEGEVIVAERRVIPETIETEVRFTVNPEYINYHS